MKWLKLTMPLLLIAILGVTSYISPEININVGSKVYAQKDDSHLVSEPVTRTYYLCTWTGTGKSRDRFRPIISDYSDSMAVIDLRPDPSKVQGYAIGYADTAEPIDIPQVMALGKTVYQETELIKYAVKAPDYLNSVFGIDITSRDLASYLAELLINPPEKLGINPLQPSTDGKYRLSLGGQIWGEPPSKRPSHTTLTDDFDRANSDSPGSPSSGSWNEANGDWDIDNNQMENDLEGGGDDGYLLYADGASEPTSDDHYAQADCWAGASDAVGLSLRVNTANEQRYGGQTNTFFSRWEIVKFTGANSESLLASDDTDWATPNGATLYFEVDGSSLTLKEDGDIKVEDTDASYSGQTVIGLTCDGYSSNSNNWDNFEGDDLAAPPTLEQEGYRWRDDDADEDEASWLEVQDANTTIAKNTNLRLRVILNSTNDYNSTQYQLEYKEESEESYTAVPESEESSTSVTYEFDDWDNGDPGSWDTNEANVVDENDSTFGRDNDDGNYIQLTSNTYDSGGSGNITQVQVRLLQADNSADAYPILTPYFDGTDAGDNHDDGNWATATPAWSTYFDITDDTNAPDPWTWPDVSALDLRVTVERSSTGRIDVYTVEISVSYNVTSPIAMSASEYISASGEATTAQLTPPAGASTDNFTAGRIQDDENPADAVDIASDNYTEMEWCIIATDNASVGEVYQFRVTADGDAIDTYTVTPTLIIGTAEGASAEVSPTTHAFGIIDQNSHQATGIIFNITNTGTVAIDVAISGTDATGGNDTWTLSDTATAGENTYGLKSGTDTNYDVIVKKTASYNTLASNIAVSGNQSWGMDLYAPTSVTDYELQVMTATVTLIITEH